MSEKFTVNLPDIGEGVVEGEVIEWLKKTGDVLKQDEPVVVVMTDKATVELPSPYPGVLSKQYFQPGQIAIKGKPLYDIQLENPGQAIKKVSSECPKEETHQQKKVQPTQPEKSAVPSVEGARALATPPVRKLAKELGISLDHVKGTGKEGRVTLDDLQGHQSQPVAKPASPLLQLPDDEEKPLIGIRLLMAKKMTESHDLIPQFSFFERVDATRLVQLRQNFKDKAASEGVKVTYMPFLIRALSLMIKKYPMLNSSVDLAKNKLIVHKQHNIGIAINTPLGLIVPVLKNVQEMGLSDLIKAYEALKQKAMDSKLQSSDMKEATITISNYGVLGGGGLWATPIINYPEVAILAIARIQKYPMVKGDEIKVCDALHLSWSFDHRVIDGEMAATFSHDYALLIQNPASLL